MIKHCYRMIPADHFPSFRRTRNDRWWVERSLLPNICL